MQQPWSREGRVKLSKVASADSSCRFSHQTCGAEGLRDEDWHLLLLSGRTNFKVTDFGAARLGRRTECDVATVRPSKQRSTLSGGVLRGFVFSCVVSGAAGQTCSAVVVKEMHGEMRGELLWLLMGIVLLIVGVVIFAVGFWCGRHAPKTTTSRTRT